MMVSGRRHGGSRFIRVLVAGALVAGGLALGASAPPVAHAAIPVGFSVQPPERLYMMPDDPDDGWLVQAIGVVIPRGSLEFVSTPTADLISMDNREIVVEFVDTEDLPGSPPPCNIVDVPGSVGFNSDYDIGNCTRIQMSVSHGKLSVGSLTKVYQDNPDGTTNTSNPAYAVYLTQSGARVDLSDTAMFDAGDDYDDNDGVGNLNINGTEQQINDALAQLVYTPDPDLDDDEDANERDFYKFEGTNPETLSITLIPEDGSGPHEWDVDIRVMGGNDWPDLEGAWELGDTGSDGPADQSNVDPGVELVIPTGYDVTDADNDDVTDSNGPDGEVGGGDDVDDPDGTDGPGDDMMLIGALDCGADDPGAGYGFHFSSSSMAPVGQTLLATINFVLGIGNPPTLPPSPTPEQQAEYDQELAEYNNLVLARDAFMTALDQTGITDTALQIGPILDYSTFWAGIGEIDDLDDALEDIYFNVDQPNDSCDMLVIISDLGNNGVPTQYLSDTDWRQYGVEVPFFGVDWDQFNVTTGDATEIDVSFLDPATPLVVNEGGTADAIVQITPIVHPAFTFVWDTLDGSAGSPDDFLSYDPPVSQFVPANSDPADDGQLTLSQFVKTDSDDEPTENFTFQISTAGGTVPPGYVLTSDAPSKNVVIPGNDPQRTILSVTGGAVTEGDSGTKNLPFTIMLDGPADGIETVEVDTSSVSPSDAGVDYVAIADQVVTFPAGATSATVNVVVNGDTTVEADDLVTLELSNADNVGFTAPMSATGTIQNDDTFPTVSIADNSITEGNAGTSTMNFTLSLSKPWDQVVGVTATTANGTATTADSDYATNSQMVTFAPGATTATFGVTINGDTKFEPNETFVVDLTNPTQATIADAQATGTITNDDTMPSIAIDDVTAPEGNSGQTPFDFTVSLSNPSADTITVAAAASDGSAQEIDFDYAPASQTLTFLPGEVTKTFTVNVNGDTDLESTETFNVALTAPTGATIADPAGLGTITNDDLPAGTVGVQIDDVTMAEGTGAGTTSFAFELSVTGPPTAAGSVQVTTSNGTATTGDADYASNTQTVNFAAGDANPQTVTVLVGRDAKYELDETFTVTLSAATGPIAILDDTGIGTIENDDATPTLAIDDVSELEGDSGTTPLAFTVTLTPASGVETTVQYSTADDTATVGDADYAAATGTLTFPPGTTTQTVTVDATGDTKYEADENLHVDLTGPVAATIADAQGVGTIENDDAEPTISIDDVTQVEGNAGTTSFVFTVSLSNASSEIVTVDADSGDDVATLADDDYETASATLTFAPGDVSETFAVTVNGDTDVEADETFDVVLSNASSTSSIADGTGVGTITNDDLAPGAIGVSISDVSVTEGNTGTTNAVFTLTLTGPAQSDTSVTATTADDTAQDVDDDYEPTTSVVTFTAGTTSNTFTVPVNGDTDMEPDEMFNVTLSAAMGLTITDATGVGTIVNDDVANNPPDPLAIQVPGNIVRDADPNQNGAIVTYPAPTTTGGIAPIAINCSSASGAFYPIGVTIVTCTAVDSTPDQPMAALGDPRRAADPQIATGSFTITVNQVDPGGTTTTVAPGPSTTIPGSVTPGGGTVPGGGAGGLPPGPGVPPTGQLPQTGSSVSDLLAVALATLVLGGALLLVRRRPAPRRTP